MQDSAVKFSIEYPERLSRGVLLLKTFLGWLYVGIPHGIVLLFYGIAVFVVVFVSWWAILFTTRYPKWAFDFVVGYIRWQLRVSAYYEYFFTDTYPPFTGKE